MNNPVITNIQRFSIHDGPGIRTTVFFKGCNATCPWCANPECKGAVCADEKAGIKAYEISCDELFHEIMKDQVFYDMDGGVTFSGGEPLLQMDRVIPLMNRLHDDRISICIETSLYAHESLLEIAMEHVNIFFVDIKIMDQRRSKAVTNIDIELYKQNLDRLFSGEKKVVFRIPYIKGYIDQRDNQEQMIELVQKYKPEHVEILYGHNLGSKKYMALGCPAVSVQAVTDEEVVFLTDALFQVGVEVRILKA